MGGRGRDHAHLGSRPPRACGVLPGDNDVHDLLWEFCSGFQGDPKMAGWILMVFNEGHFKTPEVDRLRIDGLNSDDRFTLMHAARGLATSRTSRGSKRW